MATYEAWSLCYLEWSTGDAMSNAADLGTASSAGGNFLYGGASLQYEVFNVVGSQQGSLDTQYNGMAINSFMAVEPSNVINSSQDQSYTGYAINFGGTEPIPPPVIPGEAPGEVDNQPILTWPKDQQIYYKLVGFNTNTQQFETWIIVEEIVPRIETFNPTGNFPNIDYNVFFAPPSGNNLVNIKIVGRWIQ